MSNKKKYLVKLKPIGFWFFGSERNMGFGREKIRIPYFVHSKLYPSQTTLLGGIRFLVQKQLAELNDDFSIETGLIGKESFNIEDVSQSFGIIKKVGPVYVMDSNKNMYIPCPMNLKSEENSKSGKSSTEYYKPYSLKKYDLGFEDDKYVLDGFNAKEYNPSEKFLKLPPLDGNTQNMEEAKINTDIEVISQDSIFVGKNKNRTNKSQREDAFFKQRVFTFKSDYKSEDKDSKTDESKIANLDGRDFCFAFELELNDEGCVLEDEIRKKFIEQGLKDDVLMLGSSKSTFKVTFEEITGNPEDAYSLEKRIQSALIRDDYFEQLDDSKVYCKLYYVASDTYFNEEIDEQIFSVKQTEFFRNLRTAYLPVKNKKMSEKEIKQIDDEIKCVQELRKKYKNSYQAHDIKTIVNSGSVIYVKIKSKYEKSKLAQSEHLQKIGMNQLIKISKEK